MAPRHSPETIEAIWALLCEGIGPAEIQRRLAADRAGIGYPVDIKERTLFDHLKRLRAERGEPRAAIKPGEEVDAADAIRRRSLEYLERTLADLESKAAAKPPNEGDVRVAARIMRETEELKRRAEQPESAKTRHGKRMQAGEASSPPSRLKALAREIKRREAEQTGPTPNGNGTGTAAKPGTKGTKPSTKRSSESQ